MKEKFCSRESKKQRLINDFAQGRTHMNDALFHMPTSTRYINFQKGSYTTVEQQNKTVRKHLKNEGCTG